MDPKLLLDVFFIRISYIVAYLSLLKKICPIPDRVIETSVDN